MCLLLFSYSLFPDNPFFGSEFRYFHYITLDDCRHCAINHNTQSSPLLYFSLGPGICKQSIIWSPNFGLCVALNLSPTGRQPNSIRVWRLARPKLDRGQLNVQVFWQFVFFSYLIYSGRDFDQTYNDQAFRGWSQIFSQSQTYWIWQRWNENCFDAWVASSSIWCRHYLFNNLCTIFGITFISLFLLVFLLLLINHTLIKIMLLLVNFFAKKVSSN